MGWIKPKSITFRKAWCTVEENDYFSVLKKNIPIALINEVVARIPQSSVGGDLVNVADFKICLKNKGCQCIGESNEWEEIQCMWKWINDNLIPSVQKMNNETNEIFEYLSLKFTCLSIHEENNKEQEKERELKDKDLKKKQRHFKKRFSLDNETLITQYSCSLMDKIQRHGCMYISENYVCFHSRIIPTKIKIPFTEMSEMKKVTHSSYFKFLTDSIKITTADAGKEYIFHTFFNIDETFQLLDQIRKFAMNRMLCSAEHVDTPLASSMGATSSPRPMSPANSLRSSGCFYSNMAMSPNAKEDACSSTTSNGSADHGAWGGSNGCTSPSSPMSSAPPTLNSSTAIDMASSPSALAMSGSYGGGIGGGGHHTSMISSFKEILQEQRKHQDYQDMFSLPAQEFLVEEFQASLWNNQHDITGKIYISTNFLCFGRPDLQLVLPLREITAITHEKAFGNRGTTMRICVGSQKFYFFSSTIEMQYDVVRQFWIDVGGNGNEAMGSYEDNHSHIGLPESIIDGTFSATYRMFQQQQMHLFEQYYAFNGQGIAMIKTDELKALVRGGVPDRLRRIVWLFTSGALYKPYCHPNNYYQQLLQQHQGETNPSSNDIEKDLRRSFPEHPYFQDEQGIQSLRRLLTAYSWHNPSIGYCQSMNILGAIFLLFVKEEEAFWLLSSLCEDYLPDNYRRGMVGSIADGKTFESLISTYLPEVDSHLKKLSCPLSVIIVPWFLCLFMSNGHLELGLRVLDCFFLEGTNILFQVALSCFKLQQAAILRCKSAEEVMLLFKDGDYNVDQLFTMTLTEFDSLPTDKVEQMRSSNKYIAIKNIQINKKKSKVREWSDRYNISRYDLESLYDLFQSHISLSTSQSLGIGKSKFVEMCKDVLPSPWKYRLDIVNQIFKLLDEDMDDLITCDEFVHMVAILSKGTLQERIRFCFDMYDLDHDDCLSCSEFKTLLESLICLLKPVNPLQASFDIDSFITNTLCLTEQSILTVDDVEANFQELPTTNPSIVDFNRSYDVQWSTSTSATNLNGNNNNNL
ncbi:hypothetical protein SAMD00019534_090180 [Acytostelium subglobosum LB1]|uniref:hypothetical protein n=1 Tax=Acytostelium subglobosum LB1 TaxID=1410327 RepID=UPI000644928C|nr:hypothetical protein SAMD00019534_090180 [Acytostelium subglobosum LB1]GAM25843.1 hypothetical protein SAMD00019534_090180 [Acytostelium subglobosum LB1]|eukprot:XP_012751361.1 hypothetical protein SAMD00019534_090180 [Acytostelium subglobosum LB1]